MARIPCLNCNKKFRPSTPYQVHCTPACRTAWYDKPKPPLTKKEIEQQWDWIGAPVSKREQDDKRLKAHREELKARSVPVTPELLAKLRAGK